MAGPTASVLLPYELTRERVALIRAQITGRATRVSGDDYWIEERPFIVSFGPESPESLAEISEGGLPSVLGWVPADVVSFAAMCKDARDHRLLASLCIDLAESERGIVDFGGVLSIGPELDDSSPAKSVRVPNPAGLAGVLFATSYETVIGSFATHHYGDATFLRSWLLDARFEMIK